MRIRNSNELVLLLTLILGALVAFYNRADPDGYLGAEPWAQPYSESASFKGGFIAP